MAKAPKQRYVLNLKLKTQPFQENILDKRFEIGRKVYNAVLGQALKRYREMIKTKRWRKNQNNISNIYKVEKDDKKRNKLCKLYFNIKNNMLKEFRLNEYSLHADVKQIQRHFKKNIDSFTAQKIATRVYKAIDDSLFGKGEEIHFKCVNKPLNSLEGKSNGTGIRYNIETNMFSWNGLEIPVKLDINNKYETDALRDKICFVGLKENLFVENTNTFYN
nr:hypothetical protein [Clostridium botulinum]